MNAVLWTKKIAGNEWLPVSEKRFEKWVRKSIEHLKPVRVREVMKHAVEGKSAKEIGDLLGLSPGTVNNLLTKGHDGLAILLGSNRSMFRSIKEFRFSHEVTGAELSECFYGRLTRNIQEAFLPRVREGKLDLPMPMLVDGRYVWTTMQAKIWREWYCAQRDGSE